MLNITVDVLNHVKEYFRIHLPEYEVVMEDRKYKNQNSEFRLKFLK